MRWGRRRPRASVNDSEPEIGGEGVEIPVAVKQSEPALDATGCDQGVNRLADSDAVSSQEAVVPGRLVAISRSSLSICAVVFPRNVIDPHTGIDKDQRSVLMSSRLPLQASLPRTLRIFAWLDRRSNVRRPSLTASRLVLEPIFIVSFLPIPFRPIRPLVKSVTCGGVPGWEKGTHFCPTLNAVAFSAIYLHHTGAVCYSSSTWQPGKQPPRDRFDRASRYLQRLSQRSGALPKNSTSR